LVYLAFVMLHKPLFTRIHTIILSLTISTYVFHLIVLVREPELAVVGVLAQE
jgi:hypothetical protein